MNNKILYITLLIVLLTLPIPYITTRFLTGRAIQNPRLVASITVSSDSEPQGKAIYFDASGSSGDIEKYSWDFDLSDGIEGDKTGITSSYVYKIPGVYVTTLTITDKIGNQNTATVTLTILSTTKKLKITEGPTAKAISSSTVSIGWKTDKESNTSVYYGLTYPSEIISDQTFSIAHQITLERLQPNKNYLYYIKAIDKSDNIKTSSVNTFTTPALAPAPTIRTTTTTIPTTTTTIKPTCLDGIRNQGEIGIDCGDPCKRCKSDFPWTTIILSTAMITLVAALLFFRNYFKKKEPFKEEILPSKKEKTKLPQITKEKKSSIKIPVRKPGKPEKELPKKIEKVSTELSTYIKSCIKQGFKEDQIRAKLLKAGWSKEKIDKAFKQY